jgi:lipopolysaccharide/colanic/teichoic acid biosynthesis glycosyltransferase
MPAFDSEMGQERLLPRRPGYPKRLVDLALAAAALILLAPVIAILSLAVRLALGSPIFFRQVRPGLGGKPFTLIKFRTMISDEVRDGRALSDAERLTRFGKFLRSTSLDELPELWNVLKGDMSLVGPRPLLMQYLPLYSPFQMRRHEVRPGVTGWAQVNGRNAVDWPERFALDIWYVDHVSLLLDLKILWLTLTRVLVREGISAAGEATMPYFQGEGPGEPTAARPETDGLSGTEASDPDRNPPLSGRRPR